MSKLTEVLKLFCYDPETDGNLTFNVTEALTKNWEKIDQLVLLAVAAAAAYDPEGSYAVGDYCTHGGKLHKCGTPIPDGEAWNAEHWTATTVAAELAEVRTSLANKVDVSPGYANDQFGNDLNNWFRAGFYQTIGGRTTNVPPGCDGWGLITIVNAMATSDTWAVQFFQPSNSVGSLGVPLFYRYWNTSWSKWEPIAIATPPEEHAIVPKNGASLRPGYKNSYSKDQYGRIIVNFAFTFTCFPSNGVVLFSLPQEFLPKDTVDAVAWGYDSDNKSYCCDIAITSDGNAALYHDIPNDKNIQSIHGTVVF